jgi:hypothetical protein
MNLLYSYKCLKKASAVLNKELASLNEWFQANKRTVNLSKTKYILFGFKQRLKRNVVVDVLETQLFLKSGHRQPKQWLCIGCTNAMITVDIWVEKYRKI